MLDSIIITVSFIDKLLFCYIDFLFLGETSEAVFRLKKQSVT